MIQRQNYFIRIIVTFNAIFLKFSKRKRIVETVNESYLFFVEKKLQYQNRGLFCIFATSGIKIFECIGQNCGHFGVVSALKNKKLKLPKSELEFE